MATHTPGPWLDDEDGQIWRNELRLADTCPRGIASVAPRSERPGNRRLMAAAPAYEQAWRMVPEEIRERILCALPEWVAASIAKAEGR